MVVFAYSRGVAAATVFAAHGTPPVAGSEDTIPLYPTRISVWLVPGVPTVPGVLVVRRRRTGEAPARGPDPSGPDTRVPNAHTGAGESLTESEDTIEH
jgi:hypothetical protein